MNEPVKVAQRLDLPPEPSSWPRLTAAPIALFNVDGQLLCHR